MSNHLRPRYLYTGVADIDTKAVDCSSVDCLNAYLRGSDGWRAGGGLLGCEPVLFPRKIGIEKIIEYYHSYYIMLSKTLLKRQIVSYNLYFKVKTKLTTPQRLSKKTVQLFFLIFLSGL